MNATEANIKINGHSLSFAQSMTVRVAIEMFAMDLNGKEIADIEKGYMARIREIRKYLYEEQK